MEIKQVVLNTLVNFANLLTSTIVFDVHEKFERGWN